MSVGQHGHDQGALTRLMSGLRWKNFCFRISLGGRRMNPLFAQKRWGAGEGDAEMVEERASDCWTVTGDGDLGKESELAE